MLDVAARRSPRARRAREHLSRDQRRRAARRDPAAPGRRRELGATSTTSVARARRGRRALRRRSSAPDDAIATWEQVLEIAPERARRDLRARGAVPPAGPLARRRRSLRAPARVRDVDRRGGRAARPARRAPREAAARHRGRDRELRGRARRQPAASRPRSPRSSATSTIPDARAQRRRGARADLRRASSAGPISIRVYEAKLDAARPIRASACGSRGSSRGSTRSSSRTSRTRRRWYAKVFREAPGDPAIRDQLQRLGVDRRQLGVRRARPTRATSTTRPASRPRSARSRSRPPRSTTAGSATSTRAYAAYRRALAIDVDDARARRRASWCAGSRICSAARSGGPSWSRSTTT